MEWPLFFATIDFSFGAGRKTIISGLFFLFATVAACYNQSSANSSYKYLLLYLTGHGTTEYLRDRL